jgi:hypothetical protein
MANKDLAKNEIKNNLATTIAELDFEVVNSDESMLENYSANEFQTVGAEILKLEPKQIFAGWFDGYEMSEGIGNKLFCVVHLHDKKDNEFVWTVNEAMEKQIKKIIPSNMVLIACIGEKTNDNGTFKTYDIKQKIS